MMESKIIYDWNKISPAFETTTPRSKLGRAQWSADILIRRSLSSTPANAAETLSNFLSLGIFLIAVYTRQEVQALRSWLKKRCRSLHLLKEHKHKKLDYELDEKLICTANFRYGYMPNKFKFSTRMIWVPELRVVPRMLNQVCTKKPISHGCWMLED